MMDQFETTLLQHLPKSVLHGLPQHLLDVPRQIAQITGIHVLVKQLRKEDFAYASGMDKARLLLDMDARGQSITIWCGESEITSADIGHELIHLRRAVLESVPRFVPGVEASPGITGTITLYENELEHLFVIPEEMKTFPEAEHSWAESYRKDIQAAVDRGTPEDLMMHYAQLRNSMPNQLDLGRILVSHLKGFGEEWFRAAEYLREDYKQALPHKAALHDLIQVVRPELIPYLGIARFSAEDGYLGFEPLSFGGKVIIDN